MDKLDKQEQELLRKYREGACSPEEEAAVKYLYNLAAASTEEINEVENYQQVGDEIWNRLAIAGKVYKLKVFKRISIAAAALIIIGGGYLWYNNQSNQHAEQFVGNDIAPGKNAATLTLANGRKLVLTADVTGNLADEPGATVTKTADGQLVYEIRDQANADPHAVNKLSTARGESYQLRLPDGTMVWLNAATSITYPVSFSRSTSREVDLNGEAYFEVAADKKRPFLVKTKHQKIRVLGTHFNVKAYTDEADVKTTLMEGSVKLSGEGIKNDLLLKPGEQAISTAESTKIDVADIDQAMDWKNEEFIFQSEPLESLMKRVSRWYNVEVDYAVNVDQEATFTGKVSRSKHISVLLRALQSAGLKFEIIGSKVLVKNQST